VPLDKSIDALQDRAREIAERLGYGENRDRPRIDNEQRILRYLTRQQSASALEFADDRLHPVVTFWYRSSPPISCVVIRRDAVAERSAADVTRMVSVVLDTRGRLAEFTAVAPHWTPATPATRADWAPLFDARRCDANSGARFAVDAACVRRRAGGVEGGVPATGDAVTRRGGRIPRKPVSFLMVGPWTTRR